jgi:hypothetical protein
MKVEMWQLMNPAAGRVRGLRRTPIQKLRLWLRRRRVDDLAGVRT